LFDVQKDDSLKCKVHIFADKDRNTEELPEVINFLKRLSVPFAPNIEARAMVSALLFPQFVYSKTSKLNTLSVPLQHDYGKCYSLSFSKSVKYVQSTLIAILQFSNYIIFT
jgi:uncharacterized protein YktA (UPF0223 family)